MDADKPGVNRPTGPFFVHRDEPLTPPESLTRISDLLVGSTRTSSTDLTGVRRRWRRGHWEELVQRRGPFTRRTLILAALSLVSVVAFWTPTALADRTTALVSAGQINGNGAFDAEWGGVSDDGTHDFFRTQEQLVPADTDSSYDIYERFNNMTSLVSAGQINGNGAFDAVFRDNSPDGSKVWFETREKLVSADTDNSIDVYERSGGVTTLVSQGPGNFNTATDSFFVGASRDGTKVFVSSYDPLTTSDTDGGYRDIYMRSGGTTTLISTGGNGPYGADFDGMTPDGSHIYFHTDERLAATDTDTTRDIYDANTGTGTITQVSLGPGGTGGNGGQIPIFQGVTPDGAHVYFQTIEQLTSTDTDSYLDVYDRNGSTTTEVSLGAGTGNGSWDASFQGASDDGSKVWFSTREAMVPGDMDGPANPAGGCQDSTGQPTLQCLDIYQRSGGTTTWISTGPNESNGPFEASFGAASHDGSKVFFGIGEPLTSDDGDPNQKDVYERSGGNTYLISKGTINGSGLYEAILAGISSDGTRAFFMTYEPLVPEDDDGNWQDVYERYYGDTTFGQTSLISTGPASTNAATIAFYYGQNTDGSKVFFLTDEQLVTSDTDSSQDVYSAATVNPGFPRPKGATPTAFSLVPAYSQCTSPNNNHGAPISSGSCSPPSQDSSVLTLGTPDANGHTSSSISQVRFITVSTSPENVLVKFTISDVLCRATNAACPNGPLSDFAGSLVIRATLRVSDRNNGSPAVEGATVQDFDLAVPVSCVATPSDSSTGGLCTGQVSVNSLYPGAVADLKRQIWQVQSLRVLDPGPNGAIGSCPGACGDGDEADFERPGVFVP
jgi:hypothetical protein